MEWGTNDLILLKLPNLIISLSDKKEELLKYGFIKSPIKFFCINSSIIPFPTNSNTNIIDDFRNKLISLGVLISLKKITLYIYILITSYSQIPKNALGYNVYIEWLIMQIINDAIHGTDTVYLFLYLVANNVTIIAETKKSNLIFPYISTSE